MCKVRMFWTDEVQPEVDICISGGITEEEVKIASTKGFTWNY